MGAVLRVLESHGVDASEEEVALARSGFKSPYPEPRRALGRKQTELLERGGLELDRREFGLEDPIARGPSSTQFFARPR